MQISRNMISKNRHSTVSGYGAGISGNIDNADLNFNGGNFNHSTKYLGVGHASGGGGLLEYGYGYGEIYGRGDGFFGGGPGFK